MPVLARSGGVFLWYLRLFALYSLPPTITITAIRRKTMKRKFLAPLSCLMMLIAPMFLGCSSSQGGDNDLSKNKSDEIILPEVFYGHNFCVVAGNWNESGCALIIDERGGYEIQTVSSHNEFYDIDYDLLPLYKEENKGSGKTTYFLPFKVTGQVIDDGYFKDGKEYRFYLRYDDPGYYCAVSLNDPSITTPDKELTEGMM